MSTISDAMAEGTLAVWVYYTTISSAGGYIGVEDRAQLLFGQSFLGGTGSTQIEATSYFASTWTYCALRYHVAL